MIDGIPAPGPSIFTKRTLLVIYIYIQYIYPHKPSLHTYRAMERSPVHRFPQGAPRIISTPGPVDPYPFGGDGGGTRRAGSYIYISMYMYSIYDQYICSACK